MRKLGILAGSVAAAFLALSVGGCKQGRGERCQVDSDCGSGLVCYTGLSQSVPPEGECQPSGYAGQQDAGGAQDAAPDAPSDTQVQDDSGGQNDSAPLNDAQQDSGGSDTAASDADAGDAA